jgi:flagellar hook-associated protein 3 FlgL
MRIATRQFYQQNVRTLGEQQVAAARTQQQLSTGRRILSPSDDPVNNSRLTELREQVATTEQYQRNRDLADGRLALEETVLASAEDSLQRVRVLTVQANSDALNDQDRRYIAGEVRHISDKLLELANTQDSEGDYLFAGFKSNTQPFVADGEGGARYQGDQGQRFIKIGSSRQVAVGDSGSQVFQQVRTGNGDFKVAGNTANSGSGVIDLGSVTDPTALQKHNYRIEFTAADTFDVIDDTSGTAVLTGETFSTGAAIEFAGIQTAIKGEPATGDSFTIKPAAKQSIFTTLDNLVDTLESGTTSPAAKAQLHQGLNTTLADLDQGLEHVLGVRAEVGARLNTLEAQGEVNEDFLVHMQELVADIDGLDYAEAASRLSQEMFTLEAAQQSFLRVQNLSLFNYM